MNDRKVIPFRRTEPNEAELDAYRRMTRNWSPHLRQLLLPEHFKADRQSPRSPK